MRLRQQILTQNDCYKAGRTITVKGVMVHSTGANNPNVARYVPGNDELGWNTGHNHWDQPGLEKCVHALIGRYADGKIGAVQTLPWNWRGWHAGGSANNTHISFEICEDGLADAAYFKEAYREAVEITAMLCEAYSLDPLADGVVICHQEGYRRGVASNHADVLHWFPKMGKSMDDFRRDVAGKIEEDEQMLSYEQWKEYMRKYRQELRDNDSGEWSEKARQFVVDNKIFAGSGAAPDGTPNFMWEDLLTREQCAQVLYAFAERFGLA